MKVNCPNCRAEVEWDQTSPFRPFCSKKCQLIDLGEWANEEKSLPCEPAQNDPQFANIDPEDVEEMLSQQKQDFFKE